MKFPEYKQIVNLIPGGCPQFLDFRLDADSMKREMRSFREETADKSQGGLYEHYLRCLVEDDPEERPGELVDMRESRGTRPAGSPRPKSFASDYEVSLQESLECFKGEWMPLPFLRITGQNWPDGKSMVERGPSNWARGMCVPLEDEPGVWHLVIMFDTKIEEKPGDKDGRYFALSQDDLNAASEFLLSWHVRDISWFVNEGWVDEWIRERYEAWDKTRRHYGDEDDTMCLRHLAYYMAWLDAARRAVGSVRTKVSDSNRSDAINVDLVLDIGNSRTTGILVETLSDKKTDLNNSYLLELRDLSDMNKVYTDPFETRVEFVDVSFGNDLLSRRSGRRTPAFAWPSCVRVGPEATRLSTFATCSQGNTGMSSPKRYLWDEKEWIQSWRYNTHGGSEPMVTRGLFPRQLNEFGTPLFCFEGRDRSRYLTTPALRQQPAEPLFGSHFTRSSLMMFMVGEIVTQALVNINSPANRARRQLSDKPRHLRRIIFTVPTAMPVAERRIFQRWVELAVRVVWRGMGWDTGENGQDFHYQQLPKILCEWDEASCSHMVLLYNEIMVKHVGDAAHYFRLYGRERKTEDGSLKPSVRIASIDIGGGTTDLSITTHFLTSSASESPRIKPHMEFRDGFNIAGDEVVREVIRTHVIPAIEKAAADLGLESRLVKIGFFGRYTLQKSATQRTRQAQFVCQVAVPVALGILEACENMDRDDGRTYVCRFSDFFEKPAVQEKPKAQKKGQDAETPGTEGAVPALSEGEDKTQTVAFEAEHRCHLPQKGVFHYIDEIITGCGGREGDFRVMDTPVRFSLREINEDIRRTLGGTLSSLCEMVKLYDSDLLIVTGRPSSWKGVLQTILAQTPLSADRIIPMRSYHVGSWYPCADVYGCISDPKSTVVVGAILCALSSGYLEGINFDASSMHMTSTARYVGELNMQGQLEKARVWFTVKDDGTVEPEVREITYNSPIVVGYRQLAVDRWPASRFYKIDAVNKSQLGGPILVTLRLNKDDGRPGSGNADEEQQSEGEISIQEVSRLEGGEKIPMRPSDMTATLQTLPSVDGVAGYWLDTGIVITEG